MSNHPNNWLKLTSRQLQCCRCTPRNELNNLVFTYFYCLCMYIYITLSLSLLPQDFQFDMSDCVTLSVSDSDSRNHNFSPPSTLEASERCSLQVALAYQIYLSKVTAIKLEPELEMRVALFVFSTQTDRLTDTGAHRDTGTQELFRHRATRRNATQ